MIDPGALADSHLHRAVRVTTLGERRGRDMLIADDMAATAAGVGRCAAVDVGAMRHERLAGPHGEWARHVWTVREGARVARETIIEDGVARCAALGVDFDTVVEREVADYLVHAPLGELRAGFGQLAAEPHAVLPDDFPDGARHVADALHQVWNGRRLSALAGWAESVAWSGPDGRNGDRTGLQAWVVEVLARYSDAALMIEAAAVADDAVSILWRLHGHDARGNRVRLIGSSMLTLDARDRIIRDVTLIDGVAAAVQERAVPIAY